MRRTVELVGPIAGRLTELLRDADVVSEGRVASGDAGLAYEGSTSLLLLTTPKARARVSEELAAIARFLALDPHTRVLAVRIAAREASQRAGGELDTLRAELSVRATPRGVELTVDVVAALLPYANAAPARA